jgi:hypothetical protein
VRSGAESKAARPGSTSSPSRFAAFAAASEQDAAEQERQAAEAVRQAAHPAAPGHRLRMMREAFAQTGGAVSDPEKTPRQVGIGAVELAKLLGVIR